MIAFAADHYSIELPPGHVFPMAKYRLVREQLCAEGTLDTVTDPGLIDRADLCRAHAPEWVDAVLTGTVPAPMVARIGLPMTAAVVRRARAAAAGTLAAARAALRHGAAANLAGGTHHAGRARGAGYCLFNDLATAAATLLAEGAVRRVAIVDLDVHQGDGTAEICGGWPAVFTFSMHGARNFPRVKVPGTLDVDLPDQTGDTEFLAQLDQHLPRVLDDFAPDLVLYQAGVDPLAGDRFGRLALTEAGLHARDQRVVRGARDRGIPIATVMGGGYGRDLAATVRAHANTVRALPATVRTP